MTLGPLGLVTLGPFITLLISAHIIGSLLTPVHLLRLMLLSNQNQQGSKVCQKIIRFGELFDLQCFFLLKRDTMLTAESTQEAHTNVPITFFQLLQSPFPVLHNKFNKNYHKLEKLLSSGILIPIVKNRSE